MLPKRTFRPNTLIGMLLVTTGLVGCGGEYRYTANSTSLDGLWRMNMKSNVKGLTADTNIGMTFKTNGDTVTMVSCVGREGETFKKTGSTLTPFINGDITIKSNDLMSANGAKFGPTSFSKMAQATSFSMGNVSITSTDIAAVTSSDVCTTKSAVTLLGVPATTTITANVPYQGSLLTIELGKGSFGAGTFPLSPGKVSVALESPVFTGKFGTDRLELTNGSLTIKPNIKAPKMEGTFTGKLPNGQDVSDTFALELPDKDPAKP